MPIKPAIQDIYDKSGVLHENMQNPAEGLAALNSKLKPGGYFNAYTANLPDRKSLQHEN